MDINETILKEWYEIVYKSGLFDEEYYLLASPDVLETKTDPLWHYLKYGAGEGRNPSLWFESQWYLENYPEVEASYLNPLVHYILEGKDAGYATKAVEYEENLAKEDARTSDKQESVEETEGRVWTDEEIEWFEIIKESNLFNADYYLNTYPEVEKTGKYPLAHYIEIGSYKGLNPNNWFDAKWYVKYYKDVIESEMNPLAHYILYGKKLGYETKALEIDVPIKKVIAVVGQPRSGLTLLTAILGAQEETTSWFLPYSTRKDYGLTVFESELDFKQKFHEVFPNQTMHETIVLSESSGEAEALKFLRESLLNFEREGIEVQLIWNMRNLKAGYLSQIEAAYKYWDGDQKNPSLDSLEKYLNFSRDSFRNIFEYFYHFKPTIVAYERLISDPLSLLKNILEDDRSVFIPEMEQMLKLNFAGDPGFENFSTILDCSEKRLNEWEEKCLEIEEKLPESYSTFLNWHTWIKEELASGKAFDDFVSSRGKNKFDADYYLSNCDVPDVDTMDPWEHYLQTGWMHGCQPNAWFDIEWYRENFYENEEIPDFIHFETVGWLYVRIGGGESLSSGRMQNLRIIDHETYVITDELILEVP